MPMCSSAMPIRPCTWPNRLAKTATTCLILPTMRRCMVAIKKYDSSLTYLKHLPAELLKIDQSFIRHMTENPDDLSIVKSVIGLAQAFRRQVIAEGVETKAHADLLLGIGCELAQGYGVARPMPSHEMPAWTADWLTQAVWTA